MAKIPSRKFSTAKKKIPSRKFPTAQKKIASRPFAKGTAKIASRKFAKASEAAGEKTGTPLLPDHSTRKIARQDRRVSLKENSKLLTTASQLESPGVDSPPVQSKPLAMQTKVFVSSRFNLFADLPQQLSDELFTTLLESTNVRIERIVSHGHASPEGCWYDQNQHEWVLVLTGAARLKFEDETVEMKPGDFVNIPAYKKHRVEWTTPAEPTIWLAVFHGALP